MKRTYAAGVVKALGWLLTLTVTAASCAQNTAPAPKASAARPKRQVIISIPDRKLVVMEEGAVIQVFSIAVGATVSPSPTGTFTVASRLTSPTYYHAGVVIPPGKDNPLGPRWVGLNKQGYGIHGTNAPASVGKAASHGCIRMRNRDIVQFFTLVKVGDSVEIHGEQDEQIAQIFGADSSTTTALAQMQATTTTAVGGGQ
jgi:lipoprotein-anchoring transpeptidase ErfK/SrfK